MENLILKLLILEQKLNNLSPPEKFFIKLFKKLNWFEKYNIIPQYKIDKYRMDFYFKRLNLDFEIDGDYHVRTPDKVKKDFERDKFMLSKGIKVYRLKWGEFLKNPEKEIDNLTNYIKYLSEKKPFESYKRTEYLKKYI